MTAHPGQGGMPAPCPRCTGLGDAHYLTCPTLRLPAWLAELRRVRLVPVDEAEDVWEEAPVPP